MPIQKIEMISFRNHQKKVVTFSPGINLLWGENGSGKTSVLEAVYILSNGKSFKTNRLVETINREKEEAVVSGVFGGKTTTFYIIAGLINADNRKVILEKEDITTMPMHLRSNLGLK